MMMLVGLMTTGLFAGGYYPDYGPGEQWNPLGSTGQAFIIFDSVTMNGEAVDSGDEGGSTGTCDSGDCDILGAMFNGACVGWTYMPVVNSGVTLAVELNDGTTEGTEGYPAINAAFSPTVTFNLYDASEGTMYYNVASSGLQTGTALQYGDLATAGSTALCSSDGAEFSPPTDYCAAGAGCELSQYADGSAAAEFDAVGFSDATCGGFTACGDASITATNSADGAAYLNVDNSLCTYGGCQDDTASNYCANCTADGAACTFEAADISCSYDYDADGSTTLSFAGETGSSFTCDGGDCDGSYTFNNTSDASGSVSVVENNGAVDVENGSVTHSTDCAYAMPLPEMTINGFTAGEGCIDTDYSGAFDFDGSDVDPVCGLMANTSYDVTVTGNNASGSGTATGTGSTADFACNTAGDCLAITLSTPSTYSINVEFNAGEAYGGDAVWTYQACADGACTEATSNTSINIPNLQPQTDYGVTVLGSSQYGDVASATMDITTNAPPEGEVWKLDISAKMAVLGTQLIEDPQNRIGFYYASSEDFYAAGGTGTPLPEASDGFDSYWDVPEPMIPNPDNEIHFYLENNWDEQTGWGHEWAYDIRALQDDFYASNNTTTFNGVVVAEVGGLGTLSITPGGILNLLPASETYVPVYALVNGGGHNGDYYKIEGQTDIPLTLQSGVPVTVDFIVGNLVPEAADDLSSSSDASSLSAGADWKPGSDMSWATDSSCDPISIEGIDYNDQSTGPQFGSTDYDLVRCNAYEQRYSATMYHSASSSDRGESGVNTGDFADVGNDGSLGDSEDDLEFATSYTYTVTAENKAGVGASTSTSLTTVGNVDPVFVDECTNDDGNNNDCETVISSSAVGNGSGPETDEGLVTDGSDDVHLYHTYTTAHDHVGRLSDGGTDADGLDQSGTPMTITLGSAYTDHEGYLLDASWSGDIDLNGASQFDDGNGSEVSFTTTEPNSGSGSSYTFDLGVTDNEWLTNGGNGSNSINTSITVTILPEPNQDPVADVSVPAGQSDEAGGGYWQVPHNTDNDYNCDDLVAYDDQDCDDNKASVTLSHDSSSDPDCASDNPLCEENGFWWSEAVMGMTYNDLNMNGQFDDGEPCSDGCLWAFDEDGIAPAINDGPLSIENNHQQRHSGGGGNIWTLTVQDHYGATNTAARGFYVLQEPNTRAYTSPATDASSGFEFGDEAAGNLVHYLDEGTSSTSITINTGSVSDLDGDNITYTTTLNGDVIGEASGDCDGSCDSGGFTRDLGPGEYTVTTCAQDSYDGYEYLMYASAANGGTDEVDMNVQATEGAYECTSFSFEVIAEPAAVTVTTLADTDQGMSFITMTWNESDHTGDAQIGELANNAVHYVVERTTDATDTDSWSTITTLNVVREYNASDCAGKEDVYENFSDACEDPTAAQASDDGEWYYMGVDADRNFHFLDEGLDANSTYHYRVFAINSHGRSSGIGNVLTHSTEAKPEMALSSDMSAEIYAAGEMTNPFTASFDDANGLGGHNVNSVSSSYTTYETTTSNGDGFTSAADGVANSGDDSAEFSYEVSAWETDHGQSIEVCFLDAGDYYGYDKEGGCITTATFTGSEEFLHNPFNYEGWHVFGAPLQKQTTMDDLFLAGLSDYAEGSDYVWFNQAGGFGGGISYEFGTAYFLGLNHDLVSFTMEGTILSSADGTLAGAGHDLERGWNLVSPRLVRPVDVDQLTVTDGDLGTYTWAEAQTLGIVSGEVLGTDQTSNFESSSFHPWTGFWIHVSKSCHLNVAPHGFDAAKEEVEADFFAWNMNIEAQPVEGDARGDIIKLGLSEIASNDIKDGEDTEDIPVITMSDSYLDLYMKEANGMTYWKNTKEMISPEEGQAWIINGYSANSNSDVRLSWTMDELEEAFDITMFINGEAINMREETSVVVNSEELNNITVIVGNDPLISGLATPAEFALAGAYPNPFNPTTTISYSVPEASEIHVGIFNLLGQEIRSLSNGEHQPGVYSTMWDGLNQNGVRVESGIYIYRMSSSVGFSATKKLVMLK